MIAGLRVRRPAFGPRLAVAAAAGLAWGLGQPPWSLWPLSLAGLALCLHLIAGAETPRRAALIGWLFAASGLMWSLQWIVNPFLVDPDRHGWMAPFALVLLPSGLALFWGAAAWAGRRLGGALTVAAALAMAEVARAYVLTGFPWSSTGHVWIDTPLAQLGAHVGPHGLTLVTLSMAAGVAAITRGLSGPALVAVALAGGLLLPVDAPAAGPDAPLVRIVQPNVAQEDKWKPGHVEIAHQRLLDLTSEGADPDLVVWPETAIPYLLHQVEGPFLAEIAAAAGGAPVATGIQRLEGGLYLNSLVVTGPGGEVASVYDKHHLVPFGEYVPLGELAGRLGISGLAARDGAGYGAGPGPVLIDIPGIGPALPLICYEGIFAEEVGAVPDRPRLMLLVTNDAWFGTRAAPRQHLAQARMRAIEQGVPVVRAANTGISAMIDARGHVVGELATGATGAITLPLPPATPPTLYARTGDWPALAAIAALLAIAAARRRLGR